MIEPFFNRKIKQNENILTKNVNFESNKFDPMHFETIFFFHFILYGRLFPPILPIDFIGQCILFCWVLFRCHSIKFFLNFQQKKLSYYWNNTTIKKINNFHINFTPNATECFVSKFVFGSE